MLKAIRIFLARRRHVAAATAYNYYQGYENTVWSASVASALRLRMEAAADAHAAAIRG